jgi:HD-like signal output (HDOD) protein/prolyl-tRNA editing enzyme YbaK/EbsC (Cys-tRNA(Pro) deacylase)
MPIPTAINRYLGSRDLGFEVISHQRTDTLEQAALVANVPIHKLARSIILQDETGYVMVVVPVSHVLDFKGLRELLQRPELDIAEHEKFVDMFSGCARGSYPPLGSLFGFDTIVVDRSLLTLDKVYFEPGIRTALVRVSGEDFYSLFEGNVITDVIAHPIDALMNSDINIQYTPHQEIKRKVEQVYELPPMPEMALLILAMQRKPDVSEDELASIVELDPSLAAQVMMYARSPIFSYRGTVNSVREAISRVLGYDMVMNLAVGLAIGKSFRNPVDGPLGLEAFWRHATYCAALCQELARHMPENRKVDSSLAYLSGLLHNFGFLLLGHLFQPEFYLLNKLAAANPKVPIAQLEKRVLCMGHAHEVMGMGHGQIGAWLMQAWNLQDEIIVSVREHHNHDYDGEHKIFVHLLQVANALLKTVDIGDEISREIPETALQSIGLDAQTAYEILVHVMEGCNDLNAFAHQLADVA